MINLKDSIEVKTSPEKVFQWLTQHTKDKESYRAGQQVYHRAEGPERLHIYRYGRS
jgi:hypothetical protein